MSNFKVCPKINENTGMYRDITNMYMTKGL